MKSSAKISCVFVFCYQNNRQSIANFSLIKKFLRIYLFIYGRMICYIISFLRTLEEFLIHLFFYELSESWVLTHFQRIILNPSRNNSFKKKLSMSDSLQTWGRKGWQISHYYFLSLQKGFIRYIWNYNIYKRRFRWSRSWK